MTPDVEARVCDFPAAEPERIVATGVVLLMSNMISLNCFPDLSMIRSGRIFSTIQPSINCPSLNRAIFDDLADRRITDLLCVSVL